MILDPASRVDRPVSRAKDNSGHDYVFAANLSVLLRRGEEEGRLR